jgi:hypothetical protein
LDGAVEIAHLQGSVLCFHGDMGRKIALIVFGIVLLVIGALPAIAGGLEMAFFGSTDTVSLGSYQVTTPTRALVFPTGSFHHTYHVQDLFGRAQFRLTATPSPAGQNFFLGIGPTTAVDRYLRGVSHSWVTSLSVSPLSLTVAHGRGTGTPSPPESQSFWVAKVTGSHPTLAWAVTSGSYRVVAMNTDAGDPVAFAAGLALAIPHLFAIGISLLVGGIVLILVAIMLMVLAARIRPRPQYQPVHDLS